MSMTKQQQIGYNATYGGTKYDLSPADLYGQAVMSEYLKQQRRRTSMKTEQEQIEEIEKVLKDSVADYKHLKEKGVCYCYAETLVDCGYGDISEYKAEIERLRQEVRDTDKLARNTIEQYRAKNEELENALKQSEDNYSRAFERLKAQQRDIERLKADIDHQIDAVNDAENLASHLQYDYDKCLKRLKSTQKELNELKDKLKAIAHVEPIKDVVIIKRSDFDNLMEENKQ